MLTVPAAVAVGRPVGVVDVDEGLRVDDEEGAAVDEATVDEERVKVTMPVEGGRREDDDDDETTEDDAGRDDEDGATLEMTLDEDRRIDELEATVEEGSADVELTLMLDATDDDDDETELATELATELVGSADDEALRETELEAREDDVGMRSVDELDADKVALALARVELADADARLELAEASVVELSEADAVELARTVELLPDDDARTVDEDAAELNVAFAETDPLESTLDDVALALSVDDMLALVELNDAESVLEALADLEIVLVELALADARLELLPVLDGSRLDELLLVLDGSRLDESVPVLEGKRLDETLLVALGRTLDELNPLAVADSDDDDELLPLVDADADELKAVDNMLRLADPVELGRNDVMVELELRVLLAEAFIDAEPKRDDEVAFGKSDEVAFGRRDEVAFGRRDEVALVGKVELRPRVELSGTVELSGSVELRGSVELSGSVLLARRLLRAHELEVSFGPSLRERGREREDARD